MARHGKVVVVVAVEISDVGERRVRGATSVEAGGHRDGVLAEAASVVDVLEPVLAADQPVVHAVAVQIAPGRALLHVVIQHAAEHEAFSGIGADLVPLGREVVVDVDHLGLVVAGDVTHRQVLGVFRAGVVALPLHVARIAGILEPGITAQEVDQAVVVDIERIAR